MNGGDMMSEGNDKLKKGDRISIGIIIVGIAVGALLLTAGRTSFSTQEKHSVDVSSNVRQYDEQKYEQELIEKIEYICSKVKGAGKVSVALTLDGSYRAIYAQNMTNGSNVKSEYLLVGNGSDESALLVGYSPPQILGVGIVCSGGASASVRAEIIALVSATLDLPTNKIYVTASKS
jgi:stage III sporulation protein AG